MIPLESFRMIRKIDLAVILAFAAVWSAIAYFAGIRETQLSFMISLFITNVFMVLIALLVRRVGAVTLFYLLCALPAAKIGIFGGIGWSSILILGAAGIVFEAFFLLARIEIKSIPFDAVLGAAFSNASIPFTMMLLIGEKTKGIMPYVWNFALTAFIIGVAGAIIAFIAWYNVKSLKHIIKFEYHA